MVDKGNPIKESNDLSSLNIIKLFGKLSEHENERLAESEVKSKRKRR